MKQNIKVPEEKDYCYVCGIQRRLSELQIITKADDPLLYTAIPASQTVRGCPRCAKEYAGWKRLRSSKRRRLFAGHRNAS
jgi:hypothetical protein